MWTIPATRMTANREHRAPLCRRAVVIVDAERAPSNGGEPLSGLLRQATARTQTWTAAAAEVERDRTRQLALIGNNLNQVARWANANASAVEAVEVIVHLVDIARRLAAVARIGRDVDDAR